MNNSNPSPFQDRDGRGGVTTRKLPFFPFGLFGFRRKLEGERVSFLLSNLLLFKDSS